MKIAEKNSVAKRWRHWGLFIDAAPLSSPLLRHINEGQRINATSITQWGMIKWPIEKDNGDEIKDKMRSSSPRHKIVGLTFFYSTHTHYNTNKSLKIN